MSPRGRFFSVVFLCSAGLAGAAGALLWHHSAPQVALATGTYLTPGRALGDFSLIDQRGQAFGSGRLRGHWSMLFFGYTNCPDFCPTTLIALAAMQKNLRAAAAPVRPEIVFISVDAKHDTPDVLARYVPGFDPGFIGLTAADQPGIEALARRMGVAVTIRPGPDGTYTVEHSAAIFVVDPAGLMTAILTGPFTAQTLQADFQRIVAGRG